MTITLYWWYLPIVLFLIPIIYATFRKPEGDWDFQLDVIALVSLCWAAAVGFTIAKLTT